MYSICAIESDAWRMINKIGQGKCARKGAGYAKLG